MKRNMLVILTAACALAACGGGGGQEREAATCAQVRNITCEPAGSVLTEVTGDVANVCDQTLRYVKVIAHGYTVRNGELIGSDEEYVEDIGHGSSKFFSALIRDEAQRITYCSVRVDEAAFGR